MLLIISFFSFSAAYHAAFALQNKRWCEVDFEQLIIWISGKIKLINPYAVYLVLHLDPCARKYFIAICIVMESHFSSSVAYRQKQPPEVFYQKGVPTNFSKFTGKHLWQNLSFKRLYYKLFSVNFLKFVGPLFLQSTFGRLLLYLEPCQVSMIEVFCGNSKSLTVFAKKTHHIFLRGL